MPDLTVKLVALNHVLSVGTDLRYMRVTRVSITVGQYGPFTKDFPEGQDSLEQIQQWKRDQLMAVQALAS